MSDIRTFKTDKKWLKIPYFLRQKHLRKHNEYARKKFDMQQLSLNIEHCRE